MTKNAPLHFKDDAAYSEFQQKEIMPLMPDGCRDCYAVGGRVMDIMSALDLGEITRDEAKEQAMEFGKVVVRNCTYGYTRKDGCGSGVLCRQG